MNIPLLPYTHSPLSALHPPKSFPIHPSSCDTSSHRKKRPSREGENPPWEMVAMPYLTISHQQFRSRMRVSCFNPFARSTLNLPPPLIVCMAYRVPHLGNPIDFHPDCCPPCFWPYLYRATPKPWNIRLFPSSSCCD